MRVATQALVALVTALTLTLTLTAAGTRQTHAVDVPVGVFDWMLGGDPLEESTEPWGVPGQAQAVTVNYILAAEHFNARRVDLIPDLARVANCTKNISISRVCETGGHPYHSVNAVLEQLRGPNPPVAVLGFASSTEAIGVNGFVDSWGRIPMISHWASGDKLADKRQPPQTGLAPSFVRTMVADADVARVTAKFVVQMGWKSVSIVFIQQDSAPDIASTMAVVLGASNVSVSAFGYDYLDIKATFRAVDAAAKTLNNVLIYRATFLFGASKYTLHVETLTGSNKTTYSFSELTTQIVPAKNFDLGEVETGAHTSLAFSVLTWVFSLALSLYLFYLLCYQDANPSLTKAVTVVLALVLLLFSLLPWIVYLAMFLPNWQNEQSFIHGLGLWTVGDLEPSWAWAFAFVGWFFCWVSSIFLIYQSIFGSHSQFQTIE